MNRDVRRLFWLTGLLSCLFRYGVILLFAMILIVIGLFGVPLCLYIGLALLGVFVLLCAVSLIRAYANKDVLASLEEVCAGENEPAYGDMTTEDLQALPEESLWYAAWERVNGIVEEQEEILEGWRQLTACQQVLYVTSYYEMEVNNGGLCQFFVNSSRVLAPFLSDSLAQIGANEHKELFDTFVADNGIDLSDLSSFAVKRVREYPKQTKRYAFDTFDEAFYELPSIESYLIPYIQSNIAEF